MVTMAPASGSPVESVTSRTMGEKGWPAGMFWAMPAMGVSRAVAGETETTLNCAQVVPVETQALTGTVMPAESGPAASCCETMPLVPLRVALVGAVTPLVTGVQVTAVLAAGAPFLRTRPSGVHWAAAPAAR